MADYIDILNIFKTFMMYTYYENVIIKICNILEKWKFNWKGLWLNSTIDSDIEDSFIKYNFQLSFIVIKILK